MSLAAAAAATVKNPADFCFRNALVDLSCCTAVVETDTFLTLKNPLNAECFTLCNGLYLSSNLKTYF